MQTHTVHPAGKSAACTLSVHGNITRFEAAPPAAVIIANQLQPAIVFIHYSVRTYIVLKNFIHLSLYSPIHSLLAGGGILYRPQLAQIITISGPINTMSVSEQTGLRDINWTES